MCGRYTIKNIKGLERWHLEWLEVEWLRFLETHPIPSNYNVSPTHLMPLVRRAENRKPAPAMARWGYVPGWEKSEKPAVAPINARSEEISAKPMFRTAVQKRRCLVPADGYYEWHRLSEAVKTPYHIQKKGGGPFFIAGIYEHANDIRPETYCILTTGANELTAKIHGRMPVILDDDSARAWLEDGDLKGEALNAFFRPYPSDAMETWEVSRLVNSPRNNGPECFAPVPLSTEDDFKLV